MNIEKRQIIDSNVLSGEYYFASILEEAYTCGLLNDSDMENVQFQCIELLANKSGEYYAGGSSSIRAELAQSIMKSNLYTVGMYLKSLSDPDYAVSEIKKGRISAMYQKGRELVYRKYRNTKLLYELVQKNKINVLNYSYNATLNDDGIGIFFRSYNQDYEAHESPASIDYQLCNPVNDLAGVEFIQKYLENLFRENEFCRSFAARDIHLLLGGYDKGYKDLLINIFQRVLTAALGSCLLNRKTVKLQISQEEIEGLYMVLSEDDLQSLAPRINRAVEKLFADLNITDLSLRTYIEKSLPDIQSNIAHAVNTNTLDKLFASSTDPDISSKIQFYSGIKMDDEKYRELIDELLVCRYSSDKLALIRDKVKAFGDMEDLLLDAELSEEDMFAIFDILADIEIAALIKRHPFNSDIQAEDLSESEQALHLYLKRYIDRFPADRQEDIFQIMNRLTLQ